LTVARQTQLRNLVEQDCGSCHGLTLKGGLGKPLLPASLEASPDQAVADIILDGVGGTPMPPWRGMLTEAEALWIARTLKQGLKR
jgi:cytochrome c55X